MWALNWLYSCSPQGCPDNSEYHAEIFSWKLLSAVPCKGLSAAHYLTCPITFLASVLPCSLEKPSPRARSQEEIAKICNFSKNLLLRGMGDMRNIIAGLEENIRKKYCEIVIRKDNIFSIFHFYLVVTFEMNRFINTDASTNCPSDINSLSVLMLGEYGVCVMHLST